MAIAGGGVTYRPPISTQLNDGGACPSKDCVACVGVMLADRASVGRWRLTATKIRRESGVSCWIGSGGLSYEKMAYAVRELTNGEVVIKVYYRRTRVQVRDAVQAGSPVAVSIKYSVLLGTGYECDSDFRDGHGIALNEYRDSTKYGRQFTLGDPLADGRRKGIRKGWIWAPASLMYRAGEARSAQFGSTGITIAVANDTEKVVRKARLRTGLRSKPRKDAARIDTIEQNHNYYVISTVNGGAWTRDTDGGTSRGWHRVQMPSGRIGYVPGEVLVPV